MPWTHCWGVRLSIVCDLWQLSPISDFDILTNRLTHHYCPASCRHHLCLHVFYPPTKWTHEAVISSFFNRPTRRLFTYLFFAAAALSRCRRFLNQLPTCVGVKPVAWANSRFFVGFGYGSCRYHSRSRLRVRSLKQCVFCSPSQMVRGKGNFLRTRYLSTGPELIGMEWDTMVDVIDWLTLSGHYLSPLAHVPSGRPRNFSASW